MEGRGVSVKINSSVAITRISHLSGVVDVILSSSSSTIRPLFTGCTRPCYGIVLDPSYIAHGTERAVKCTNFRRLTCLRPGGFIPSRGILRVTKIHGKRGFFILQFGTFGTRRSINIRKLSVRGGEQLVTVLRQCNGIFVAARQGVSRRFEGCRLGISPRGVRSLVCCTAVLVNSDRAVASRTTILNAPSVEDGAFMKEVSCLRRRRRECKLAFNFLPLRSSTVFSGVRGLLTVPGLGRRFLSHQRGLLTSGVSMSTFFA